MRKVFELGGFVAAVVLIAFGVGAIALSVNGRSTIHDNLAFQGIVGSPDMTPAAIKAEAASAKLDVNNIPIPSCSVAGKTVTNGSTARCFAQYMQIHALEASGGLTYAQMGRFLALSTAPKSATDGGGGTNDQKYAVLDPKTQQPLDNGRRNVWVTETALTTALNLSYTAQQISLFGLVVGIALLLSGIGFGVLAVGGALRNKETALEFLHKSKGSTRAAGTVVPTA
jgi:hypothetical protein